MAVPGTKQLQVLMLLLPFFTAALCSIQVDGIDNEVVILSGNRSTVPKNLVVRRVSGIRNSVTITVADRATIAPGVECSNVNISSINGIDNRVSIIASTPGQSGECSNNLLA